MESDSELVSDVREDYDEDEELDRLDRASEERLKEYYERL